MDEGYIRYYIGSENASEDGESCLNWMNVSKAEDLIGVAGVGDHNFCRKPEGKREFCYVSQTKTKPCKVRSCGRNILIREKLMLLTLKEEFEWWLTKLMKIINFRRFKYFQMANQKEIFKSV